ncbi:DODA-type extradiol aromatic ring-opening family dioxygenase [Shewanella sp. cp20]|uniref:DODA-type extradiol aromatic ring-opening family dioxygenase n=1 Tax=Shewanella sp. cp20 TaxID=1521167 RepID=UPI000A6F7676|nr:class III extradiol ring-cleavage dioxygenase [Shewanella sp. cp20]
MSVSQISREMSEQLEAAKGARLMPSLFVSHGSPMLALEASENAAFLAELGQRLPRPKAIVVFSAHTDISGLVRVASAEAPRTVHDFYGFPDALFRVRYPAPGAPQLAAKIVDLLQTAGFDAELDEQLGWDHGLWTPLTRLYPAADIPLVLVSIDSRQGASYHYRLGQAVKSLRAEGVLILGSGGISHNLGELFRRPGDPQKVEKMQGFVNWIADKLTQGDLPALLDVERQAPHTRFNHPSTEHLMPFYVALGAGHTGAADEASKPPLRLHQSVELQILALDTYAWLE